jgi:hypothetical protein
MRVAGLVAIAIVAMGLRCGTEPDDNCGKVEFVNGAGKGAIVVTIQNPAQDVSYLVTADGQQHVGEQTAPNEWTFSGLPSGMQPVSWDVSGCPKGGSEQAIPGPGTITVP